MGPGYRSEKGRMEKGFQPGDYSKKGRVTVKVLSSRGIDQ
tara:strand:- start:3051 stop:3170 length:120 start_codon:yes stop_codon:yes gene_type:complete